MHIRMMLRKCVHCGHRYIFDPVGGKFGWFCPKCLKLQMGAKDGK